jgi:SulP family sulfate permease
VYAVTGELFFASADAHIRDASSVAALDAVTTTYAARGKTGDIVGLNQDSADTHGNLTGELTGNH